MPLLKPSMNAGTDRLPTLSLCMTSSGLRNVGWIGIVAMKTICTKCDQECDVITIEGYDIEECWGAPVRRPWFEDVSECCEAEIEEIADEKEL